LILQTINQARDQLTGIVDAQGKNPTVYILASSERGTLYVGVTSDLIKRACQHRTDAVAGFSKKYSAHILVWYEQHLTMLSAITREKAIKAWKRGWKIELIETSNPTWRDLFVELL
jgi:putative endonuclease